MEVTEIESKLSDPNQTENKLVKTLNENLLIKDKEKLYKKIYETLLNEISNEIPSSVLINILKLKNITIHDKEEEIILKSCLFNAFLCKFKASHFLTNLYKKSYETSCSLNITLLSKIVNFKFHIKTQTNTKFFLFYKNFLQYLVVENFDEYVYMHKDLTEYDSDSNILLFKIMEYFLAENLICKEFQMDFINVNKYINKIQEIYTGRNLERMFILINRINIFAGSYKTKFRILCCLSENPMDTYAHHLRSLIIYQYYNNRIHKEDIQFKGILIMTLNRILTHFTGRQVCYLIKLFNKIQDLQITAEIQELKETNKVETQELKETNKFEIQELQVEEKIQIQKEYLKKTEIYKKIFSEIRNNNSNGILILNKEITNIILSSLIFNCKLNIEIYKIFRKQIIHLSKNDNYQLFVYGFMFYKKDSINYAYNIKEELKCYIFQQHLNLLIENNRPSKLYIYLCFINQITENNCKFCLKYLTTNVYLKKLINIEEYNKINKTKEYKKYIKRYKINEPQLIFTKFMIKILRIFPLEFIKPIFKTLPVLKYKLTKVNKNEIEFFLNLVPFKEEIKKQIDPPLIPYLITVLLILKNSINQLYDYIVYFNNEGLNLYLKVFIPFLLKKDKESFPEKIYFLPKYIYTQSEVSKLKDFINFLNEKQETLKEFKKTQISENIKEPHQNLLQRIINANIKQPASFGLRFLIDSYLFIGTNFNTSFLKKLVKLSKLIFQDVTYKKYTKDINSLIIGVLINRIHSDYLIMKIIRLKYFLKYYENTIVSPLNIRDTITTDTKIILQYPLINYTLNISITHNLLNNLNEEELELLFYSRNDLKASILIILLQKLSTNFNLNTFILLFSFIHLKVKESKEYFKTIMYFEFSLIKSKEINKTKEAKFLHKSLNEIQLTNQIHCKEIFEILINYELLKYFNNPLDFSINLSEYKKLYILFYLSDIPILKEIFLSKIYPLLYLLNPTYKLTHLLNKNSEYHLLNKNSEENIIDNLKEISLSFNIHQIPESINFLNIFPFLINYEVENKEYQLYTSKLENLKFFIPQNIAKLKRTKDFGVVIKYLNFIKEINEHNLKDMEFIFILVWQLISNGAYINSNTIKTQNEIKLKEIKDTDILIFKNTKNTINENTKNILTEFLDKILSIIPISLLNSINTTNTLLNYILNLSEGIIKYKTSSQMDLILKKNMKLINDFIENSNKENKDIWFFGFVKSIDETPLVLQSAEKAPLKCVINYKAGNKKRRAFIFKAMDDCRQDNLAIQLIEFMQKVFEDHKLEISLIKYDVTPLKSEDGKQGGIIHMLENTISRHQVSQQYSNNLNEFYLFIYKNQPECIRNFLKSFVGYSLFSYIFNVKDRHNANILFDKIGFYIHIDFGFIFDISPGNLNLEPGFKLTKEILDFLNKNLLLDEFYDLFIKGFLVLREKYGAIVYLIKDLKMGCFTNKSIYNLKQRLFLGEENEEVVKKLRKLIFKCSDSSWTKLYDRFQGIVNDIRY